MFNSLSKRDGPPSRDANICSIWGHFNVAIHSAPLHMMAGTHTKKCISAIAHWLYCMLTFRVHRFCSYGTCFLVLCPAVAASHWFNLSHWLSGRLKVHQEHNCNAGLRILMCSINHITSLCLTIWLHDLELWIVTQWMELWYSEEDPWSHLQRKFWVFCTLDLHLSGPHKEQTQREH